MGKLYRLESVMDQSVREGVLLRIEGRVFDYGRVPSSKKQIQAHCEVAIFEGNDGAIFERRLLAPLR